MFASVHRREIEERLHRTHSTSVNTSSSSSSSLQCSYSSSLPMHEYFSEIETHFHKRNKMQTLTVSLIT